MVRTGLISIATMGLLAASAGAAPACAQATRTWVSGVGDDVNPCSRTAPCKTFAGAISKTAAGGEISVLDPGGYGAVTITKSISIVAEGGEGSTLAAGTNGIVINAGPNDTVTLHGLFIEGGGTGTNGIRVIGGANVHIRDVLVRGFRAQPGNGVLIEPNASSRVVISDTTIEANTNGIVVRPAPPNPTPGAVTPRAQVVLNRVEMIQNSATGVTADGATASVTISGSLIAQNATGLAAPNGGQIASFRNNVIIGNAQNGAPTSHLDPQ